MNVPIDVRVDHRDWDLLKALAESQGSNPSEALRDAIRQARDPEVFATTLRSLIMAPEATEPGPTKNTMIRIPLEDTAILADYAARLGTTSNRIVQMLVKERVMIK